MKKYASGIMIFRSNQCPYVSGSVNVVAEIAKQVNLPVQIEHIKNCKEAQNSVHLYGTFCVLLNGKVLTYHSIIKKELLNYLAENGIALS